MKFHAKAQCNNWTDRNLSTDHKNTNSTHFLSIKTWNCLKIISICMAQWVHFHGTIINLFSKLESKWKLMKYLAIHVMAATLKWKINWNLHGWQSPAAVQFSACLNGTDKIKRHSCHPTAALCCVVSLSRIYRFFRIQISETISFLFSFFFFIYPFCWHVALCVDAESIRCVTRVATQFVRSQFHLRGCLLYMGSGTPFDDDNNDDDEVKKRTAFISLVINKWKRLFGY